MKNLLILTDDFLTAIKQVEEKFGLQFTFDVDVHGQVVIYTGLEQKSDTLIEFKNYDSYNR